MGCKLVKPGAKLKGKLVKIEAKQGPSWGQVGAKPYCQTERLPCCERAFKKPFRVKSCWQQRATRAARVTSESGLRASYMKDYWK